MATFDWVETFISLEGEFVYQGYPTVYVRFTGCNFTCQGFNNPENKKITNEVLGFDPKDFNDLKELPLITMGCDSLYAHDKRFNHLWKRGNETELATELVNLLPDKKWKHPKTGHPYILSLTGGEPTLRQKTIPKLLNHPLMDDLQIVLIETNAAVPITDSFLWDLEAWVNKKPHRKIIWSNSPKLSASGENWDKAIKVDVINKQTKYFSRWQVEQYFKFVCGPNEKDFDEVEKAMNTYFPAGLLPNVKVGIMPEACTTEQQNEIAVQVADMCIKRGYIYVHRLQNTLWGNEVGT